MCWFLSFPFHAGIEPFEPRASCRGKYRLERNTDGIRAIAVDTAILTAGLKGICFSRVKQNGRPLLGPTVLKRQFDCWKILGSRGDFPSVDTRGGGTDDGVAAHTPATAHNALKDHHARARKRQGSTKVQKPCKGRGNYER